MIIFYYERRDGPILGETLIYYTKVEDSIVLAEVRIEIVGAEKCVVMDKNKGTPFWKLENAECKEISEKEFQKNYIQCLLESK